MTYPSYESKIYGDVPVLQSSVVFNQQNNEVCIFILNCDQQEELQIELDFRSFGMVSPLEHVVLDGTDLSVVNSFANPEA